MMSKVITVQNAGTCTAYELRCDLLTSPCTKMSLMVLCVVYRLFYRQELVRRGAFDLEEDKVNFKSLLQRLMVELVAEERTNTETKTKAVTDETAAKLEAAKQERDRKKQEALERSRQRQADPEYFRRRSEQNEEAAAARAKTASESATAGTAIEPADEEEQQSEESHNDDPFRTYKSKGKSKVFVK
jgi:hypothetical protein